MTIQVLKKNSLHNLEHSQYAINLHTICTEANIEKINALLPALQKAIDKEEQALNLPRGKEFIKFGSSRRPATKVFAPCTLWCWRPSIVAWPM